MMLDLVCEADDVGLPGPIYAGYRWQSWGLSWSGYVLNMWLPTVRDNIGTDVVRTDLVMILLFDMLTSILHAFALRTSLLRVLKVTIAATHKTRVIGKSQIAYGPSTDGNGQTAVMERFLYDSL